MWPVTPKFVYVVAETILYNTYDINFNFDDVIIVKFPIKGENA